MQERKIDTNALLAHLRDKWHGRPCQQCGVGNWTVQDKAFELREFAFGTLVAGGPVIPVVPVICTNCGNTLLVNAIIAKAVGTETPKPGEKP